jgi:peptide/nickel transport system substrate-binding protein
MASYLGSVVRLLSARERIVLGVMVLACLLSGLFLGVSTLRNATSVVPRRGGEYIEGIVGQPSFINPVLAQDGTPEKDLVKLLFASALDVAESVKHDDSFRIWTLRIKDGVVWHDQSPLTSDDIIFTIQTIQNPDALSPLYADWQNVVATRASEREIRFELLNGYSLFENLLDELYPIPKKLFADLSPAMMKLSSYNLEPIGNGPFSYVEMKRRKDGFIEEYTMHAFDDYAAIDPRLYITTYSVRFFENELKLVQAYNVGAINGFGTYDPDTLSEITLGASVQDVATTKYYAAFFNASAYDALALSGVRKALTFAVDKQTVLASVFGKSAVITDGPLPPTLDLYTPAVETYYRYDPDAARQLITQSGWTFNEEIQRWQRTLKGKDLETLSLTLTVPDVSPLKELAQRLKAAWEMLDIPVTVATADPQRINSDIIQTRNYQILLFGNIVSLSPDPFSFWHSSERFSPGLNLALYQNARADELIGALRQALPQSPRYIELFARLQETIASDYPALFLTSPRYFYVTNPSIKGIVVHTIALPHDRFNNVITWYLETHRVFGHQ